MVDLLELIFRFFVEVVASSFINQDEPDENNLSDTTWFLIWGGIAIFVALVIWWN